MRFSRAASYNNPHEMFPSASKLFAGMNAAAGGVTKSSGKTSRASSMSVVNEAEDGELSSFLQPPVPPHGSLGRGLGSLGVDASLRQKSANIVLHELTITKNHHLTATT